MLKRDLKKIALHNRKPIANFDQYEKIQGKRTSKALDNTIGRLLSIIATIDGSISK